jgi:hypothetical protein
MLSCTTSLNQRDPAWTKEAEYPPVSRSRLEPKGTARVAIRVVTGAISVPPGVDTTNDLD